MSTSRHTIGLIGLSLLGGCAWILPKPTPPAGPGDSVTSMCTLDLAEARKAAGAAVAGGTPAEPLIIALDDGPSADRAIRSGHRVLLQRATTTNHAMTPGEDTAVVTINAVDAAGDAQRWLIDRSVVRVAPRAIRPEPEFEFLLLKADMPSPNRPTTCDGLLRDGDYVFLQSTTSRRWAAIRHGELTLQNEPVAADRPCREPRESCYTDRYGAVLCVNYFACGGAPNP